MNSSVRPLSLPLRTVAAFLILLHFFSLWPVQMFAAEVKFAADTPPAPATVAPKPTAQPSAPEVSATLPGSAKVQVAAPPTFSVQPTLGELVQSRVLALPMLPIGNVAEPSAVERAAIAQALLTFSKNSPGSEDTSALEGFLAAYPQSAFRVSLLTSLGLIYRQHCYWSKALAAWQQAWQAGKDEQDRAKQVVVDQALAHLAELTARLGRPDDLKALFVDAGARAVHGAAAEQYEQAHESLSLMQSKPDKSYRCGPFAVGQVFHALHPERSLGGAIHDSVSTDHGTSLVMVNAFARKLGLDYQLAHRSPGAAVLVPSVVNWKVGHYAALTEEVNGSYAVKDPTFTDSFVASRQALDQEASGYFLVRAGNLPPGWQTVSDEEGQKVWGRGAVPPSTDAPPSGTGPCSCQGMAVHSVDLSRVNLYLDDAPFFYSPPRGPAVAFKATYSQRDKTPNTITQFPNLGLRWNCNWVTFIVDDPNNQTTSSYGPGGGTLKYQTYNIQAGAFAPQADTHAILQRTSTAPYVRTYPDGSKEVFGFTQSIGGNNYIFMTESDDPSGNRTLYNYNASTGRLDTVTDTMGNIITLTYASNTAGSANFYSITGLSDQAGRTASFSYDPVTGLLSTITDMVGLQSSFTYDANDAVIKLHTPYGDTTFANGDNASAQSRSLQITDPEGGREHVLFEIGSTSPDGSPSAPNVPGFIFDGYFGERNTFYWDKQACAKGGDNDLTKAHLYHWLEVPGGGAMSDIIGSEKPALESRIFYNYVGQQNQSEPYFADNSNLPTLVVRTLTNGSTSQTQLVQLSYNAQCSLTRVISPTNRTTTCHYDTNGINLLAVYQENPSGASTDDFSQKADLVRSATYDTNGQHLVTSSTDAAGQTTNYTYNAYGQPQTITNAKNETTTLAYSHDDGYKINKVESTSGYLFTITGAAAGAITAFGYDGFGRIQSVTDSEGYKVTLGYDALNRVTQRSYPDGKNEQILYENLDPQWVSDRLGRWTQILHDKLRHPTVVIDPLGRTTQYDWCSCGSLEGITDPAGNHTVWMRDVESRVTAKVYADGTSLNTFYEPSSGRVSYTIDAKQQYTRYAYNLDDSLATVSYTDSANNVLSTPGISYGYDPVYPRPSGVTVAGLGTTTYTYNPIPSAWPNNAGRLHSEGGLFANDTVTYSYDQLGRVTGQAINGSANASTYGYDSLGRVSSVVNPLGTNGFTYNYVDSTARLNSVLYPDGQTTTYSYYGGTDVPRLQTIKNLTSGGGVISQFDYTYSAVGDILSWTQNNSGLAHPQRYGFGYDADSELTSATLTSLDGSQYGTTVSTQAYSYDTAGNRTSVQNGGNVSAEVPNSLNQLTSIMSGGLMRFAGAVGVSTTPAGNRLASVTVGGNAATVRADGSYEGWAQVSSGSTTSVPIVATDTAGQTTTKHASVSPVGMSPQRFGYDPNGNQTTAGPVDQPPTTCGWDAANRLVSITNSHGVTLFGYDGLGRRVTESVGTTAANAAVDKHWIWVGLRLAEERDANNNVTKRFFTQGEQIAGQPYFYTQDHLGSVCELTDNAQTVRGRYSYDPYGVRSANLITSNAVEADFGFTSHYFHASSGLHLAPYRAYNANIARWLSRDPMGEAGGVNLYGYVENGPANYIDPDGRELFAGIVGAGVGLGFGLITGGLSGGWKGAVSGGLGGLVTGGILGLTNGAGAPWAGAAGGLVSTVLNQALNGQSPLSKCSLAQDAVGASVGALGGALGGQLPGRAGEVLEGIAIGAADAASQTVVNGVQGVQNWVNGLNNQQQQQMQQIENY